MMGGLRANAELPTLPNAHLLVACAQPVQSRSLQRSLVRSKAPGALELPGVPRAAGGFAPPTGHAPRARGSTSSSSSFSSEARCELRALSRARPAQPGPSFLGKLDRVRLQAARRGLQPHSVEPNQERLANGAAGGA